MYTTPIEQIYKQLSDDDAMFWARVPKGGMRQVVRWGCEILMEISGLGMCDVQITPNADKRHMLDVEISDGEAEHYYTVNHEKWRTAFKAVMESLEAKA